MYLRQTVRLSNTDVFIELTFAAQSKVIKTVLELFQSLQPSTARLPLLCFGGVSMLFCKSSIQTSLHMQYDSLAEWQ